MREEYRLTGADVSSLEFAIEPAVQSSEEDEENGFPPGSINYMLDQIRENQTTHTTTQDAGQKPTTIPAFSSTIVTHFTTTQDACQKPTTIPSIIATPPATSQDARQQSAATTQATTCVYPFREDSGERKGQEYNILLRTINYSSYSVLIFKRTCMVNVITKFCAAK